MKLIFWMIKSKLDDQVKKCNSWIEEEVVAKIPSIEEGPFAAGPAVGKAEEFKTWLKAIDKNYLALDMESGYAADAIASLDADRQPEFLTIRAISDPGNSQKPEFDEVGPDAFRSWAMQNIVLVVTSFLTDVAEFDDKLSTSEEADANTRVIPDAQKIALHPGQRIDFEAHKDSKNKRFSNLRREVGDNKQEEFAFEQFICALADAEDGAMFLVEGAGGCGKSSMMRLAESELNKLPDEHVAKFIDLRDLYLTLPAMQQEERAEAFFRKKLNLDGGLNQRIVVLVDELFGHPREKNLISILQKVLAEFPNKVVLAFGFDHYETSKTTMHSPQNLYLYNFTYEDEFRLKNTNIDDDKKAIPLIEGLLETSMAGEKTLSSNDLLKKIRSLDFPYLNAFVVSLVLSNEKKKNFRSCSTSTEFVLFAMRDELESRQTNVASSVSFDDICIEALRVHTPELHRLTITPKRSAVREYYDENFAQFPKLVQTSLIANAVAILMSYPPDGSQKLFDHFEIDSEMFYSIVFGCDVTAGIKNLLNDSRLEEMLLKSALSICSKVDGPSLSFALVKGGAKMGQ